MKKWTKADVLAFMESKSTGAMSTNQFLVEFLELNSPWITSCHDVIEIFRENASVEQILRARRYIIKSHWIWVRVKADKEIDYIKEHCLQNKI